MGVIPVMQAAIPNAYSDSIYERVYGAPLGRYFNEDLSTDGINNIDCRNRRLIHL